MTKQVAFLGLGNMGSAMAVNLINAGFDVRGFDPSRAAQERAVEKGITCFSSPAEAATGAQVICSSVHGTEHAMEAYLGENGALGVADRGTVCFDFSTISVESSQRIAAEAEKKGVRFLDTPVSGSVPHAKDGTLAILAGGDPSAIEEHRDVLDAVGKEVHHFGPNGTGLQMKLVTNQVFAVHISAIAEALTLGKKSGLDPQDMVRFLKASVIPKILDYKASPMVAKDYTPIASVNLFIKDLRMIVTMAEETKVPIPLCSMALQVFVGAAALGYGDQDQNAIVEYFEKCAGL